MTFSRWPFLAFFLAAVLRADPGDVAPAVPVIPGHSFRLADYGSSGDGKTSDAPAFARALAAVKKAGGGTLEIPAGTYLVGPLELFSRLHLHLDSGAKILFSAKSGDYSGEGRRLHPQMSGSRVHDVLISGQGTIDGQGGAWWAAAQAMRDPVTGRQINGTTTPRPPMLVFAQAQRIQVEGITLQNSPGLNLGINACQDVIVSGITIFNPPDSPNTDGIDPKGAQRVLISHCHIDTGDDCIAAGGSRGSLEKDILITDCEFLHGHGCSIGSGTAGGVRNFTVRRCSFDGTDTGIRLKSARDRGGLVENLVYTDLTMKNVGHAFSLNSHYEGTTTDTAFLDHVAAEPVTPTTPQWRHIVVRNVTARACRVDAGMIVGLPEMPAEGIVFDHVTIEAPKGLQIGYARNLLFTDVRIDSADGKPLVVSDTVEKFSR